MAQRRDRSAGPAPNRRHQLTCARSSDPPDGKQYGGTDRHQRTQQQLPGIVGSQRGGDLDLDNCLEDLVAGRVLRNDLRCVLSRRFGAMAFEAAQSDDAENKKAQDADETPAGASLR